MSEEPQNATRQFKQTALQLQGLFTPRVSGNVGVNLCAKFINLCLYYSQKAPVKILKLTLGAEPFKCVNTDADARCKQGFTFALQVIL